MVCTSLERAPLLPVNGIEGALVLVSYYQATGQTLSAPPDSYLPRPLPLCTNSTTSISSKAKAPNPSR